LTHLSLTYLFLTFSILLFFKCAHTWLTFKILLLKNKAIFFFKCIISNYFDKIILLLVVFQFFLYKILCMFMSNLYISRVERNKFNNWKFFLWQLSELNLYKESDLTHYNQQLVNCTLDRCWRECLVSSHYDERIVQVRHYNRQVIIVCIIN